MNDVNHSYKITYNNGYVINTHHHMVTYITQASNLTDKSIFKFGPLNELAVIQ